jgi:hypothetical protein
MKNTYYRNFVITLIILSVLGLSQIALAAQIRLAWDPNTESDLAGYKIYYGTSSRTYTNSIDVENVTTYTLSGLIPGQTYYIAVTAYDTSYNESGYSNEVSGPPTTPTGNLKALYVPSGDSMNPYINELLTIHGLEIDQRAQIPNDLTNYDLIIVSKNEACNSTSANSIRNFVLNGGGAIIMNDTPRFLADGLDNLSSIRDWFGAGWHGNDGGYGVIAIDHPFGTDLLINDNVDYSASGGTSIYDLNSETTAISTWNSNRGTHSFIHNFGQGRVFYYASNPGHSDNPTQEILDNGLVLFEAGLLWTLNVPAAATLVSPTGIITTTTPTYTWNAVSGATSYQLYVYDSTGVKINQWYTASRAGCPSGTGNCSVTPSTSLASGGVTWWIQTWNSVGYGPWSSGRSFTISP